jgi:hypothetical protein
MKLQNQLKIYFQPSCSVNQITQFRDTRTRSGGLPQACQDFQARMSKDQVDFVISGASEFIATTKNKRMPHHDHGWESLANDFEEEFGFAPGRKDCRIDIVGDRVGQHFPVPWADEQKAWLKVSVA